MAQELIISKTTKQQVVPVLTLKAVIARTAQDTVITGAAPDGIISLTGVDMVVTRATVDQVIAAIGNDPVVPIRAGQDLIILGPCQQQVFGRRRLILIIRARKAVQGIITEEVTVQEILISITLSRGVSFIGRHVACRKECIGCHTGGEDAKQTKKCKHDGPPERYGFAPLTRNSAKCLT